MPFRKGGRPLWKAKALQTALSALIKPQAAYDKAMRARDELLPAWTRAYARLKKIAAAAWVDDAATFESVFAPVDAIQAPVKKRPKKTAQPTPGNVTARAPASRSRAHAPS